MCHKINLTKSDSSIIGKISTRNIGYLSNNCCSGPPPELSVFYVNHTRTEKSSDPAESTRNHTKPVNESAYITKERFYFLNRDLSNNCVVKSTSTIFYDLDEIAKKQSLTCSLVEPSLDIVIEKTKEQPANQGFGQPCAIVQECETYKGSITLLPRDSKEIIAKKGKKKGRNDAQLSSEILKKVKRKGQHDGQLSSEFFLRDDNYEEYKNSKDSKRYFDRELSDQQKFWSYAKYHTDYTKPIPEEVKLRRKDRGKRGTEDPCPCQLFSYACPCENSNKNSLSGLLNQIKSVNDHQTSTEEIHSREKRRIKKQIKECKVTNTSFVEQGIHENKDTILHSKTDNQFKITSENMSVRSKRNPFKKIRQVTCPKCKEIIEVASSTDDGSQKPSPSPSSPLYQKIKVQCSPPNVTYVHPLTTNKLPDSGFRKHLPNEPEFRKQSYSPNAPERMSPTGISKTDGEDYCRHDPTCEMIPVCQVLPPEHPTKKCGKSALSKTNPRIIRITKACRHHPPCTVVPSCQRANVLKNNCEYVPPCMHRPRCVNLPLCVPMSKTFDLNSLTGNHEDTTKEQEICAHSHRGMNNESPQDSLKSNEVKRQCCNGPHVQNTIDDGTRYAQQIMPQTRNPSHGTICAQCHITAPTFNVKHNESVGCQYEVRERVSDAVVFIRDVGCQFRNKRSCPKTSFARLVTPSMSFELMNVKMGNYYTGLHTLRYENKCTSADSNMSLYGSSSDSDTCAELSPCASPRIRQGVARCMRGTGFPTRPSTYVAAFSTCLVGNSYTKKLHSKRKEKTQTKNILLHQMNAVKSKKSILNRTHSKNMRGLKSHGRRRHLYPVNPCGNGVCFSFI
ncbi:hypothetical protein O0L34_g16806 [Tuta absoluta]|nr:hypothetical protein O0L34_g16806 [Tuta absoluta]